MLKLQIVPLSQIEVNDSFWNKYIRLVPEVIIPYQWNILNDKIEDVEPSHCISNFEIAAGYKEGEFQGAVFQDTDLAKWLEAVAYSLVGTPNKELEATADRVIQLIGRAQDKDGYLNTYFTIKDSKLRWTNLKEGHELYTAGHMIEAAVAYYNTTGKDEFLDIMIRNADLICEVFSDENNSKGYPGHQEIELALVKLYEVTGTRKYLNLARSFIERRGKEPNYFLEEEKKPEYKNIFSEFKDYLPLYSQSHLPVREQMTAEGHAVRAVYMYCAMADLAYEYQDEELFNSCLRIWDNIVYKRMYITGGIGSSGILERFTVDYDLPNNNNYSETCASIGLALFGRRMVQITQDGKYMDIVEKALYNSILSGIAMDGKSFFYVNPLEVWPENCLPRTSKEHIKPLRQKWFGVACCPPNIARTLASLGEYAYFQTVDSLWINLFLTSKIKVELDGKFITLWMKTDYPRTGKISIGIVNKDNIRFRLAIRIPAYVLNYDIWADGVKMEEKNCIKGYEYIEITGQKQFDLEFDIQARYIHANPKVREDSGKVAIVRGPLVYCMEETDNGDNLPAFYADTNQPIKEENREDILDGVTILKIPCKKISDSNWESGELYSQREICWEEKEITAVPYCYWGNRKPGEMLVWMKELVK